MGKLCDFKLCHFDLPAERGVSLIMKQGMKQRGFLKGLQQFMSKHFCIYRLQQILFEF